MKAVFLYGAKCNPDLWNFIRPQLKEFDIDYVAYPHEMLKKAMATDDIVPWAAAYADECRCDVVVGHSMGGQIALSMLPLLKQPPSTLVLIESNPVPSGPLYRNLMTEEHMKQYGEPVLGMLASEAEFYTKELLLSLTDGYDLTPYIRQYRGKIHAIYGNRGRAVGKRHADELCLPEDIISRMELRFIRNACHLPMIENPTDMAGALAQILTCAQNAPA